MPTTLTGLLLFVALLLPGFAYLVGKERHTTGQNLSAFRETAAVVAASVTFELMVVGLFAIFRTVRPSLTPDVGALIRNSGDYLRGQGGHAGHYGQVALWAAGMLTVSVALAYGATAPGFRAWAWNSVDNGKGAPRLRGVARDLVGEYPHESNASAWWTLFDKWEQKSDIHVGCILDDGSFIEGRLASFSREADDKPERDLILTEPISYRPAGEKATVPYAANAVCLSAAKIVTMFVTYIATEPTTSSGRQVEAGVGQASVQEEKS